MAHKARSRISKKKHKWVSDSPSNRSRAKKARTGSTVQQIHYSMVLLTRRHAITYTCTSAVKMQQYRAVEDVTHTHTQSLMKQQCLRGQCQS